MKRELFVLALAFAPACAKPHHARYASWEPTSPEIPATPDRALAKARLGQGRALFEQFLGEAPRMFRHLPPEPGTRRYSYARVDELASDRLAVTLFAVERGRVVLRALLEVAPARIGQVYWDQVGNDAAHWAEVFVERGTEVGTHQRGSPALSVEALYEQCEREVLGADAEASPRLNFDPKGLLMQCGFAPDDCSDCPSISIHSLSTYPLTEINPELEVERWFCRGDQGPILPGAFYAPALPLECQPPPPPPKPLRPGEHLELADICRIDPKACPQVDEAGDRARLQ